MSKDRPSEPLRLMGAPGSPYTRKMIAVLRYRRVPYAVLWGGHQNPPADLPSPKVRLLPTVYFPTANGSVEAVVDSTPIIRRLEKDHVGRAVVPPDAVLRFLDELIEDYGDEWLTKAMFHFRWAHEADIANASPLLVFWSEPKMDEGAARERAGFFAKRQIDRLYVVGSNPVTAETIEQSYGRLVDILDRLLQVRGYILGSRPSSADFAVYGQLTQLAIVEPTSAALTMKRSPRVRAWLDRVEDLSGLEPSDADWFTRAEAKDALNPILKEIGRVYVPFLRANAAAIASGEAEFSTEIDGRPWTQPTFPYQAKCLQTLRDSFARLGQPERRGVLDILEGTGCEALFD